MGELVICVPTYNRPDVIQELMVKSLSMYQEYGIDVYIYDSSESGETEKIVEKNRSVYPNLSYIRVDFSVHSNIKVYNIFRHFQHIASYKYIWICSDFNIIRWSKTVITAVCEELNKGYDMIVVNYRDVENLGTRVYDDKNDFFTDCAWHMTSYGATIIKMKTVLENVDWEYMIARYTIPERINFSHVSLYFEQLSRMTSFKALHMSVEFNQLVPLALKQISGWRDQTFFVWCYCWPNAVNALPDCYQNKKAVIKKHNVNSKVLSLDNIVELRGKNIYSFEVYKEYKKGWKNLTNINRIVLFFIAMIPYDCLVYFTKRAKNHRKKERIIKKIHAKFCDIYIYGCGKIGSNFADYFDDMGVNYKGFLVSDMQGEKKVVKEHTTQEYSPDLLNDRHVAILLALGKKNTEEVLLSNPELRKSKQVFRVN